jgi:outer membrane protein assembly factor BamD
MIRRTVQLGRPLPALFRFVAMVLLPVVLFVAGCSARKAPPSSSPGDLIVLGRDRMNEGDFEKAREAFNRILQDYPESNLRSEALLSLADSFYESEEYQEAKFQYEKFIQLYPVNPQTPRALYFLGMCDFRRLLVIDREQTQAQEAFNNFSRLVRQFPQSPLVAEARPKIRELEIRLSEKQYYIASFYYSQADYQSAIPRYLGILKRFPKTPPADKALYYLADSYLREDSLAKAGASLNRLIKEYPKSSYRKKAERKLADLQETLKSISSKP